MKKLLRGAFEGKNIFGTCVVAAVSIIVLISAAIMLYGRYEKRAEYEAAVSGGAASVTFVDVGQGDCTLISACGKNILIDSGEYEAYGDVCERLSVSGVDHLDCVVMTHPHTDHMGCMFSLVENFGADTFIMPDVKDLTPSFTVYNMLMEALAERGTPIMYAKPGTAVELGENCRLEIIAPVSDYDDQNNYSAVVRFVYGDVKFLITGDIEREAEADILASGADISADVIKVPHHGSGTSSSKLFVQAVSPRFAVFSVGESNDYGHPHSNIVDLYRKTGSSIYRTDMNGDIMFVTDGREIRIMTEK